MYYLSNFTNLLWCVCGVQDKQALVSSNEELQSLLDELGKELQQAKEQVGEERKNCYDLKTQLEVQLYEPTGCVTISNVLVV